MSSQPLLVAALFAAALLSVLAPAAAEPAAGTKKPADKNSAAAAAKPGYGKLPFEESEERIRCTPLLNNWHRKRDLPQRSGGEEAVTAIDMAVRLDDDPTKIPNDTLPTTVPDEPRVWPLPRAYALGWYRWRLRRQQRHRWLVGMLLILLALVAAAAGAHQFAPALLEVEEQQAGERVAGLVAAS